MPPQVEISVTPAYVRAKMAGIANNEEALEAWAQILGVCAENNLARILAEIDIQEERPISEYFRFGERLSAFDWPRGAKVAVVCAPSTKAACLFTENVLVNRRALETGVFDEVAAAELWLAGGRTTTG